ncbi:MAG: hypothetical protein V6006_00520 [Candidatus Dasytiphilus stammeri]
MASDVFGPFIDIIEESAPMVITCVIQTGRSSLRDEEVSASAHEHNIAMIFTSHRHCFH